MSDPERLTVQVGQVEATVYSDETVADLFDRLDESAKGLSVTPKETVLCRPRDPHAPTEPDEADIIPFDLDGVEDGDEFSLYRVPSDERPAYPEIEEDRAERQPAVADGGEPPTRAELAERVAELEKMLKHVTAQNRRDTAPEGSW